MRVFSTSDIVAHIMIKALFTLFFLSTTAHLLLGAIDEKELRHLHHLAESAMNRCEFSQAKEAYEHILDEISSPSLHPTKYPVDWMTYVDLTTRLAEAHLRLKEYAEGEKLLNHLVEKNPPSSLMPLIRLLQSRFRNSLGSPGDAYQLMKEALAISPISSWRGEDRSLFHTLEYMLNNHYEQNLQKAKRFFAAGCYKEAKQLYETLLDTLEKGHYPKGEPTSSFLKKKLSCCLAEVNFCLADYEKTLALISSIEQENKGIDCNLLYLAALSYLERQEYEQALEYFDAYLQSAKPLELPHYEHALFEKGFVFYQSGNFSMAKEAFEKLQTEDVKREKSAFLAMIYLARIYLMEKKVAEVEKILSPLSKELKATNPLQYEIAYLRGKAAFEAEDYALAARFFEASFPSSSISGKWCEDAFLHLGWCHLKQNEMAKAEGIFRRLLRTHLHEEATLSLGKLYLLKNEKESFEQLENLLLEQGSRLSLNGKLQALLLRAETKSTFEEKEFFYEKATDSPFEMAPSYGEAWFCKGLNHFQMGIAQVQKGSFLFEKAISEFERALLCVGENNREQAMQWLKWEIQTLLQVKAPWVAIELTEKGLTQFSLSGKLKEELCYLRGLIAAHQMDEKGFALAEESLSQVSSSFPKGRYADHALYVLGTLYYQRGKFDQSKAIFLRLAENYPSSSLAANGWFFAAEAGEKLGNNVSELRKNVFEKYPLSEYADAAYFYLFSVDAYQRGEKEALLHLERFATLFPHSSFRAACAYFLGLNAPDFETAKTRFEEGLSAFEKKPSSSYSLIYFHYRTTIDLALLYLKQGDLSDLPQAMELLEKTIGDFEIEDHPWASKLKNQTSYPPLYEESEFTLALCLLKAKEAKRAQEIFARMLSHYSNAGIKQGYYLARLWQEQGLLALEANDHETALRCFQIAQRCGQNFLHTDQKLSLWISESECYKRQKSYDLAMRKLSAVVNEDVVSPLRMKAMLLRAELYELQGRYDLALRQLEGVAKKGGEWALIAEQQIKEKYGID